MDTIGVRELRQHASEILREVEAGQTKTVTLQGRPVAEIIPIKAATWTTWDRISRVFGSPTDPTWEAERRIALADELTDPWER